MTFTDYQARHIDALERLAASADEIATALTHIANRDKYQAPPMGLTFGRSDGNPA